MNLSRGVEKLASKTKKIPTAEFVFVRQGETQEAAYQCGRLKYPDIDQLILFSFISLDAKKASLKVSEVVINPS
jgi:hypothetical protein